MTAKNASIFPQGKLINLIRLESNLDSILDSQAHLDLDVSADINTSVETSGSDVGAKR